jgi:hypothetical protein
MVKRTQKVIDDNNLRTKGVYNHEKLIFGHYLYCIIHQKTENFKGIKGLSKEMVHIST